MRISQRGCIVLLLILAAACGGSTSTSPTPTNLTVSSPNSNVLFGATEQMTAVASDGRALVGSWSSDNAAVATVSPTGLVTPTGAGQATIIFTASGGQQGTKLLRGLPNLNGTFTGTYTVTSCGGSGELLRWDSPCIYNHVGRLGSYTFTLMQSNDVVRGQAALDSATTFTNISGTVGLNGNLTLTGVYTNFNSPLNELSVLNETWNLTAPDPQTFIGSFATSETDNVLSGLLAINGTISTVNRTASLPPVFAGGYSGSARRQ
jgi:hypothetical protein